ncbi:HNH endonuclease [Cohnella lupini]|uniref:Uncharacterized protein (TIGR02646 family) n=1 Tax=Cohnella lupini TaxID=1294267 RepID=A0A3D9HZL3_9BACL|nr:HNH endonuclease [Cohnella lupini]RED54811.1 uncharacterized protein (TIGR02646 family) [Cohnella lupini]
MIKITKKPCPNILSPELKDQLTKDFIATEKSVWKIKDIEITLLESSHYKCVYCECKLMEESKFMEIDHYYNKDNYPDLVLDWDNLLPSCKRCNGRKSDYDTKNYPFINPSEMDPREHLTMRSFKYYPKTENGKMTIRKLLLNDIRKMLTVRFDICKAIQFQVDELVEKAERYQNGIQKTTNNKNKIISITTNLLYEAQPESAYAATVATELMNSIDFRTVLGIIKDENIGNVEIDTLFKSTEMLAL